MVTWSSLLKMVLLTKTTIANQAFRKLVKEQIYVQKVFILFYQNYLISTSWKQVSVLLHI